MIQEGDGPSVQCEMSFTWSNCMREVDDLNLIFIDFNVLNRIETALHLSENIILFAIRGIYRRVIGKEGQISTWCLGVSFIVQCWGQGGTLRHPLLVCR